MTDIDPAHKPPSERQPTLRVLAMAADTNAAGDIFGGWLLAQIDLAGSIEAYRRAGGRVVTVAVNSVQFHRPVFVGDLVSCYTQVTRVGRTSLTVDVEVYVERACAQGGSEVMRVTEARLTFVALDAQRRPREVGEVRV